MPREMRNLAERAERGKSGYKLRELGGLAKRGTVLYSTVGRLLRRLEMVYSAEKDTVL